MKQLIFSKDDVLKFARENKVKSIRLMFMDLMGINKNVEIPVEDLKIALNGEIMFDGSSIEGFSRIEESDMFLMPDPSSFVIFPWSKNTDRKVARLICDIVTPEGDAFGGCPRGILKKVIEEAEEMGYVMSAGPEAEFFIFHLDENGRPTVRTHDHGGYFDLLPVDKGEEARKDIVYYLEEMGFKVEASHHEVAPGQHEIDFKYSNVLTTADNLSTFRLVVKMVAYEHGLHATFMPKPIYGINGSGMHTHQALFHNGNNVFFDDKKDNKLSDLCLNYIAGLLEYASEYTAVTNPLVNSYKRLVPDYEAPVYIAWSEKNRSPLVRIPAPRGQSTRVELRSPDPACNPYLSFALMLKAGLEGIKRNMTPPPAVNENIYAMTPAQLKKAKIKTLPKNLLEAVENMEKSKFVKETLGEHVFNNFVSAKKLEWNLYNQAVHNWELNRYLATY
ncbi:MAG: type I glutamate--ammonia ligase [Vulcanimicrobiota bacterium]